MSDTKHVVVTREGLQRMKEELEYKETTEKMKVAEQLKVAISYGDLSENAEYDAAKNDQAVLEQRIAELKAMIENAVVVDESKISTDTVGFGTRVTIVYEDDPDEEETYTIVGTSEGQLLFGAIFSAQIGVWMTGLPPVVVIPVAALGAALVGAHVGETVVAQTPGGALRIKVIEIAL